MGGELREGGMSGGAAAYIDNFEGREKGEETVGQGCEREGDVADEMAP